MRGKWVPVEHQVAKGADRTQALNYLPIVRQSVSTFACTADEALISEMNTENTSIHRYQ